MEPVIVMSSVTDGQREICCLGVGEAGCGVLGNTSLPSTPKVGHRVETLREHAAHLIQLREPLKHPNRRARTESACGLLEAGPAT
jgi:hypothetical protein